MYYQTIYNLFGILLLFMNISNKLFVSFANKFHYTSFKSPYNIIKKPISNGNVFLNNKKIISISPGGYKGFYVMGICKYIKETYNLNNYVFSGASAGAWNSLLLCCNKDIHDIQNKIMDSTLQKTKSIQELENLIKLKLLTEYTTDDFDLRRLFIGVTTIYGCKTNTTIFSGFDSLSDAINCCIASSHIPFISGGFSHVYRNVLTFDGGFSKYPYLNTTKSVLHITPSIWQQKSKYANNSIIASSLTITDYTTLFSKDKYYFNEMIENGYNDALHNKEILDNIFTLP